jgi:hypothetical protein
MALCEKLRLTVEAAVLLTAMTFTTPRRHFGMTFAMPCRNQDRVCLKRGTENEALLVRSHRSNVPVSGREHVGGEFGPRKAMSTTLRKLKHHY